MRSFILHALCFGYAGHKYPRTNALARLGTGGPCRKFLHRLLSIALCWLLVSCQKPEIPTGTFVKVQRTVSGQTIEIVRTADKIALLEQVRLIGIEAPDLKQQPWGEAAKNQLEKLIGGKQVLLELDVEEKDRFDRFLAYLWEDGVLVNERLVKEGYALATVRSPNKKYQQRLVNAQEWARLMGKGIWNPKQPLRQTPGEFRQQNNK
ncbi:MAG: thermonuclease family protein [Microcoleus sp.]